VNLPQHRNLCKNCAPLRRQGLAVPSACAACRRKNSHLIPDDAPEIVKAEAIITHRLRKKREGLKYTMPEPVDRKSQGGFASMTSQQRARYNICMYHALRRAKYFGKRIDGARIKPIQLGCLSVAKRRKDTAYKCHKSTLSFRCIVGRYHKIKQARVAFEAGLLKVGEVPGPEATRNKVNPV